MTETILSPDEALPTLREHLLVDGFDLVLDLEKSHGSTLVDARDGSQWLEPTIAGPQEREAPVKQ
jgi:L-lysine 6-transaminase